MTYCKQGIDARRGEYIMKHFFKELFAKIGKLLTGSKGNDIVTDQEPSFLKVVSEDIDCVRESIEEEIAKGNESVDVWTPLADSFRKMVEVSPNDHQMNKAWMKYFGFAVKYVNHLSPVLLEWLTVENYRTIFSLVKNTVKHYMGNMGKRKTDEINYNKIDAVLQLSDYILDKFDPNDIPAYMMKGQLLRVKGDYRMAEKCFKRVMQQENGFNGLISLLDCYIEEQMLLWDGVRTTEPNDDLKKRLKALRKKTRQMFVDKEYELRTYLMGHGDDVEAKVHYMTLITKYARWERNMKNYQTCDQMLQSVPEDYPEYYRILTEMGLLHQFRGSKSMPNPYYNVDRAIELFEKADQLLEKQQELTNDVACARKSVLIPLANSYVMIGRIDEARRACMRTLDIDPNENKAKDLLHKLEIMTEEGNCYSDL